MASIDCREKPIASVGLPCKIFRMAEDIIDLHGQSRLAAVGRRISDFVGRDDAEGENVSEEVFHIWFLLVDCYG